MTSPFGAPPPRKPSILDRVAARLFPTAQYTGLLDPSQQEGLQHQGLLNVGLNLLQAGAPSTHQAGTLANIGSSIQGVDFPEMAQNALKLQQYKQGKAQGQAVAAVAALHPAKPGESREESYNRLLAMATEIAAIPGGAAIAEKFAPLITALKPDKPERARWSFQTVQEGGENVLYRVNEDTGVKYRIGLGRQAPPNPQERVAGSQFESASQSVQVMRDIAQRNPEAAKAAVAAIQAGGWGRLGKAYSALRGFTSDPDAQNFYTQYKNMVLTVTPTYGGARPTQQLMDLEQASTLPALGSGDFETAFHHMEQRLADLRAKAGHGMPAAPSGHRPNNPFARVP